MKPVTPILFLLSVLLISCGEQQPVNVQSVSNLTETLVEIPNITADKSSLFYNNKKSLWTLNDQLFSGYALSYHPSGTLKEKIGIWQGRKQNRTTRWYADGHLHLVADYHNGKLHGEKKMWTPDTPHVQVSSLNYQLGKAHGEQTQWYPTGELYKKLNLELGKEVGIQKAFRKNGELYANYEVKNGRRFGLVKASLCYGLDDEKINYDK